MKVLLYKVHGRGTWAAKKPFLLSAAVESGMCSAEGMPSTSSLTPTAQDMSGETVMLGSEISAAYYGDVECLTCRWSLWK